MDGIRYQFKSYRLFGYEIGYEKVFFVISHTSHAACLCFQEEQSPDPARTSSDLTGSGERQVMGGVE